MTEVWKGVFGYIGLYEVSSEGRVRSLARTSTRNGKPYRVKEKILKPSIGSNGYPVVNLAIDGHVTQRTVHTLVAEAFIGLCLPGQEVRHGDGKRDNPRLGNLSHGTRKENVEDAQAHGTHVHGELVGNSKLKVAQIHEIRRRARTEGPVALGKAFGVSYRTIIDIRERRRWAWLAEES